VKDLERGSERLKSTWSCSDEVRAAKPCHETGGRNGRMRTATEGDLPPAEVGAVTGAPENIDQALNIIRSGQDSWSVIISPRRAHAEKRRLVYQARAALEETLVALHVTELSP